MDSLDNQNTVEKNTPAGHAYALKPGDVLDQYRVLHPLGAGGMGEVYLVENVVNHKKFALKVLPLALSRDAQFVGRFKIESRVMMDLDHPHIVRVHHAGESRGMYYLTMDYIEGPSGEPQTLEDLMEGGNPLPPDQVLSITLQICDALEYAHGHGIVHRDLKPSNILLTGNGEPGTNNPSVRISDFGLAKILGQTYLSSIIERSVSLSIGGQVSLGDEKTARPKYERTSTRSILGTYDYMSPEQKTGGEITPRSDIYAFGMMLYRMLTGRKAEGAYKPPSRFGVSRRWDATIEKCLQSDPTDRFESVAALRKALEGRAPSRPLLGMAAAAVVLLAAGGAWFLREPTAPKTPPPPIPVPEQPSTIDRQPSPVPPPTPVRYGALRIETTPAGAEVRLEGHDPKTSPAELLNIQPGRHDVTIERPGHYPVTVTVAIAADKYTKTNVVLRPHEGRLRVSSEPAGAEIWVGGKLLGTTPEIVGPLPVGRQALTLKKPGYRDQPLAANVEKDDTVPASARLAKREGWLRIETQGGGADSAKGELRLGGKSQGSVALPLVAGPLDVGALDIEFKPNAGGSYRESASVEDGTTNRVVIALTQQPQEGGDWVLPDLGITMKWIPPGSFLLGSTPEERAWAAGSEGQGKADWFTDEGDRPRSARIRDGFWLGETEVTRGLWKAFISENPGFKTDAEQSGQAWVLTDKWGYQPGKSWRDPNFAQDDRHPAVCISWNDATAFCEWLTRRERRAGRLPDNLVYRLPGEAEWEYACRGGREGTKFWWGDRLSDGNDRLNLAGTEKLPNGSGWDAHAPWDDGYAYTAPVDSFDSKGKNGFGLADMLGNVWEWCLDGYDSGGAHDDVWTGDTSQRVLRGGSFGNRPGYVRCANRGGYDPTGPDSNGGFRVCLGVAR